MTSITVRAAVEADMARIVALVTGMFEELGTPVVDDGWQAGALARLRFDPDVAAFVADDARDPAQCSRYADPGDFPVAVAVGVVDRRLPSPRRPAGRVGYLEWLATDPRHRRRGAGRAVLEALLRWFDEHDVPVVDVHTSTAARSLYEGLGFRLPHAIALRHAPVLLGTAADAP